MVEVEKPISNNLISTKNFVEERPIFNTKITIEQVEKKLTASLNTTSKFGPNAEVIRLGVGQGFLSVIARIQPDWTPHSPDLPESIIAKIPCTNTTAEVLSDQRIAEDAEKFEKIKKQCLEVFEQVLERAHNGEVEFYNLAEKFKLNLKIPKLYFAEPFSDVCEQGILFIEDAGTDSFVAAPFQPTTVEEAKEVLHELAYLHATSMKYPEMQQGKFITIVEVMKQMDQSCLFNEALEQLRLLDEARLGSLCDQMIKHLDDIVNGDFVAKLNDEYGLPPVLLHGDLWSSNVLWTQKNGKKELRTIVDWQIVHSGCIAEDIVRYLACALSGEDRRNRLDELLQYYFTELQKVYGSPLPFAYDQLKRCLLRIYPFAAAVILPMFGPIMTVQIGDKFPDKKDEYMNYMIDKAVALAEDILYYLEYNKNFNKTSTL